MGFRISHVYASKPSALLYFVDDAHHVRQDIHLLYALCEYVLGKMNVQRADVVIMSAMIFLRVRVSLSHGCTIFLISIIRA